MPQDHRDDDDDAYQYAIGKRDDRRIARHGIDGGFYRLMLPE